MGGLIPDGRVVLRCDVVRQVVVEDEAKKTVEEGEIDLLVNIGPDSFRHDVVLGLTRLADGFVGILP